MKLFLLNIFLAVLWLLMWGSFDVYTLLAGFVVGYLLIAIVSRAIGTTSYVSKIVRLISFMIYFNLIVLKSNWQVAKAVLRPGPYREVARVIRYPVKGMTDIQITTLANSISLTPGTLSLDVSDDHQWLYVHCMFGADRAAVIRDIDELRNRLMQEVFS